MSSLQFMITQKGFEDLNNELLNIEDRFKNDLISDSEKLILEKRQKHLKSIIPSLNIVGKNNSENISFGNTVQLENLDSGELISYTIVGTEEVNVNERKISNISPFAKELLGKTIGDEVFDLNDNEYEIISIS